MGFWTSLRTQLALAGTAAVLLVAGSGAYLTGRALDDALAREVAHKALSSAPLLSAALIDPLLQRDYATVVQILEEVIKIGDFKYFLLLDEQQQPIVTVGKKQSVPIPELDDLQQPLPWDRKDQCLRLQHAIRHGSQLLGHLHYGLALEPFAQTRSQLRGDIQAIALAALILGAVLLFLAGYRITKGLNSLTGAISDMAKKQAYQPVEVAGPAEVQLLAVAFNQMGAALDDRFKALERSKALQSEYLQLASEEKAWLESLLAALDLGVLLVDQHNQPVYQNRALHRLWQAGPTATQQVDASDVLADMERAIDHSHSITAPLSAGATPGMRGAKQLLFLKSGATLEETHIPVTGSDGQLIGNAWIYEDVTTERKVTQAMRLLAEKDSLTGLLNRHTFISGLTDRLARTVTDSLAVLFIDLDNFKHVNDLNGHATGDVVLSQVAQALSATFRPGDLLGRIGGDEFVVAVPGATKPSLQAMCERLQRNVQSISMGTVQGESPRVGCSIGVAWYPKDGTNAQQLVAAADQAMYTAKADGRGTWREYQLDELELARKGDHLMWTDKLNQALEQGLFRMALQGVYSASDLTLQHHEALIRLSDPDGTHLHLPESFIPHAEYTGKITSIDRWMIGQCVSLLARHPSHLPIAVNVSAKTLVDTRILEFVQNELATHGVTPHRLHLELTETSAVSQFELAEAVIAQLQHLGCVLTIDDFGSGFSSVQYLTQLRANSVKIDGQFVQSLLTNHENRVLLKAIVEVAHAANMKVVAEWVDSDDVLEMVRSFGVDLVQGYLMHHPELVRSVEAT